MMLAWGPDLIQLYNDRYRDMIGEKHPAALGQRASECWAEIWDDIRPLFERVRGGEAVEMEDMPLTMNRHGEMEEAHFTFAYSPVRGSGGEVLGVLDVAFDTTEKVRGRRLQEEREALYRELELERSRLEYVFQRAPSFLAVLRGRDFAFKLANEAYLNLIGRKDVSGKPLLEVLPELDGQGFVDLLEQVVETGEPHIGREAPVMLERKPGQPMERRFVDFVYLPLVDPDGSRSGIITHGTDVTDHVLARREVERLLAESEAARLDAEEARREAEAANRSKTQFLSAMSHELRTPLNAIGGYTQLIQLGVHGAVTEAQLQALERITVSQTHLLRLINDILSYARMEAGGLDYDLSPIPVHDVLAGVESLVLPQAIAKGIALSIEPGHRAGSVIADDERVRQIVLNLVSNALKFTGEGGHVTVSCSREDDWTCLHVADDGIGISREDQAGIFDAFRQVGRSLNDPQEGIGLGLAISRDLAAAMGGQLSVASEKGQGSTFTLRLKRAEVG